VKVKLTIDAIDGAKSLSNALSTTLSALIPDCGGDLADQRCVDPGRVLPALWLTLARWLRLAASSAGPRVQHPDCTLGGFAQAHAAGVYVDLRRT
jgi:hypothetical protein